MCYIYSSPKSYNNLLVRKIAFLLQFLIPIELSPTVFFFLIIIFVFCFGDAEE